MKKNYINIHKLNFNFAPLEMIGDVKKNYEYFSFVIFTKIHSITYIPFKKSEYFKFFKNNGISISRSKLETFYDILISLNHIKMMKINGKGFFVINNWKEIMVDLGMWFCSKSYRFKRFVDSFKNNNAISFRDFYQRVIQSFILVYVYDENNKINHFKIKREKVLSFLKYNKLTKKYTLSNHLNRSRVQSSDILNFVKLARKAGLTLEEFLISEEKRLYVDVKVTASYLSHKFGLSLKVMNDYLNLLEKNNLIDRVKVMKEVFKASSHLEKIFGIEANKYYNYINGTKYYQCTHSNVTLKVPSIIQANSIEIKSSQQAKFIKKKSKYKII